MGCGGGAGPLQDLLGQLQYYCSTAAEYMTGGCSALETEAVAVQLSCQEVAAAAGQPRGGCKGSRAVEPRRGAVSTADLAKDG